MHSNANRRAQTSTQGGSSSSSSSTSLREVETSLSDNINESSTPTDAMQPRVAADRENIQDFLQQFITLTPNGNNNNVESELREFYLKQMRLRDRAAKQLYNIEHAKDQSGRVPTSMQIKARPEVPGNKDIDFQLEWARAISAAEETLSSCTFKKPN